jgi:acetoin utilization deacetylase AcuC-like enzyme
VKTIYTALHRQHAQQFELNRGRMGTPFERPERADRILEAVRARKLGPVEEPAHFALDHAKRVHAPDFVEFLQVAHADWVRNGGEGDALPITWAIRGFRDDKVPESIVGRLSYYSFDGMTAVTPGTWTAVQGAVNVALTAARCVSNGTERAVFALCRPPGHHAGTNYYGGYCFLNNAAIAAQFMLDRGRKRVAILDVDYHHGNGTQEIFYARKDVLFVSLHADPATDFPYFLGYADETGRGDGAGCNLNLPLPQGTTWQRWSEALEHAKRAITAYAPEGLVVSLGVDTFEGDELSAFKLTTSDFLRMGASIARLRVPTVFVMEGGYGYEQIGTNTVNVLEGFEAAER